MTLWDSSVLIDYLDGVEEVVDYVEDHFDERSIAPLLVPFEVYQGEVFRAETAEDLQDELQRRGEPLAARDAFVAGTVWGLDERLVVADADFDVDELTDLLDLDLLEPVRG